MGDHSRQHDADTDGQQGHDYENILQRRYQWRVGIRNAVNRHQVPGAVQNQHKKHGAGEFQVKRPGKVGQALRAPVFHGAPEVKRRSGICQRESEQHCRKPKLLESEHGG